jgi:hypothetical protein
MTTASNWNVSPTDRRAPETFSEKLSTALAEAASAFGREHWQPWKFQIEDQFVELFMGAENETETVADWREKIIRCGAALQLLKLSLKRQGCLGRVKLFPELDRPFLVARVYLTDGGRGHEPDSLHFDDTAPGLFQPAGDAPISGTLLYLISHAVAGERCWLELAQGQRSRERLLELAGMNEQWLFEISGERPASPPASPGSETKPAGYNGWQKFILGVKLRAPVPVPETGKELDTPAMSGTFAVIKTKTDDKYGWLAAGETNTRLQETARKLGVSCTFFNHALRKPAVRQELRTNIGHKGFGQAIVQLKTTGHPLAALASSSTLPLRQTII